MRRKFYVNISGICHNHNEGAGEGGGSPTPPPAAPPADPPAAPPADPPADPPPPPAVPDGYVPATEVETERTARTAAETARTEAETARATAEAALRAAQIREAARDLNLIDPADAERFIPSDATDFRAALEEVVKTKTYLVRQAEAPAPPPVTPTQPTNPGRDNVPAVTKETLKTMSAKEVAALLEGPHKNLVYAALK